MVLRRLKQVFAPAPPPPTERPVDPVQDLDALLDRQIDLLRDLRRSLVEVTASKRRLEVQAFELNEEAEKLDDEARTALESGDEARARELLARRQPLLRKAGVLGHQAQRLQADVERLASSERRLQRKLEAFRTRTDVLRAQQTAAQASLRATEAMAAFGEESMDADFTLRHARKHVAIAQAQAELAAPVDDVARFDAEMERLSQEVAARREPGL